MAVCPHDCNCAHLTLDRDVPFGTPIPLPMEHSECVHVRQSCGGNTHVLCCLTPNLDATKGVLFGLRYLFCDDRERIASDEARFYETEDMRYAEGVLFDSYGAKRCGEWVNVNTF